MADSTLSAGARVKPVQAGAFQLPFGKSAALRAEQADRMEAVLASTPYPFIMLGSDPLMLGMSAASMLGVKGPEIAVADLYRLVVDEAGALQTAVQSLLREQSEFTLVLPLLAGVRYISFTGRLGISAQGRRVATLWLEDRTSQWDALQAEKLAQADLHSEVERLHQVLDNLNFPCWRRDSRGKLVWCNQTYANAVDIRYDDVIREQREITSNLKDRAGRTLVERAIRDGRVATQTKHVVIAGNRRLMEFMEVPIEGGTIGFAFDLTPMDDLRTELARHKDSHSEVLETLSTAVAVFGADQKIRFHNSAFCTLWGLEETWLETGPTISEVLEHLREDRQLPEQADFRRFKQDWLQMFTSLIEPYQELMYRPDGTAIRLAIVPHPMGGLLYTFEDVTSRLALESSYNTLIEVQRETLNNLGEGIAVFGGDGRLDLWNPAFCRMWHLPETEMSGRPHVTELAARIGDAFNGRNGVDLKGLIVSNAVDRLSGSGRMDRADGSVLEYHSVLLPDGGVLNSFLDVSDSVRVEQALRDRNAALEDADRLKLDFLANVSYQLRTPLNAMIGFAEMLIKQYSGPLNDKQMGYARGTLEAGERLVMLVDAVLDLSTIEAGYMQLTTGMVYLDDILDDIHALVDEWANKQEVALLIDCPSDVGAIEADERRLKQVLSSLISNALKFTPPGGRITIAARRLPVVEGQAPMVTLTVTDTGDGIPQADQARIFEPFEHGRTRRSTSTGVGLALVRSFITLHGGYVELESTQGVGTSVVCYLPVTRPAELDAG